MIQPISLWVIVGLLIGGGLGALMGYFGKCTTGACPLTANPWRGGVIGALIGGMFAFSAGSARSTASVEPGQGSPNAESRVGGPQAAVANVSAENSQAGPRHITSADDFESAVLKAEKPVLVDFYADWCGPCRMLAPTIEKLAKEYQGRAIVAKVNVDSLSSLASQYGIQGIPAVFVFNKGQVVQRLVGLRPQSDYAQVLDKLVGQAS